MLFTPGPSEGGGGVEGPGFELVCAPHPDFDKNRSKISIKRLIFPPDFQTFPTALPVFYIISAFTKALLLRRSRTSLEHDSFRKKKKINNKTIFTSNNQLIYL